METARQVPRRLDFLRHTSDSASLLLYLVETRLGPLKQTLRDVKVDSNARGALSKTCDGALIVASCKPFKTNDDNPLLSRARGRCHERGALPSIEWFSTGHDRPDPTWIEVRRVLLPFAVISSP